ncbi:MFS transporter [Jidongwangia harbinensis]|uniref:MFS transporter n=1 Tax=Jidongwangia harbinensis TaxID=2878561 RepID=UPI001CD97AAC|nr:MFS transporter [Jidongwangia harbinensis]MCA2216126.1 MFS transporter [Jidongwangia harbinensis]
MRPLRLAPRPRLPRRGVHPEEHPALREQPVDPAGPAGLTARPGAVVALACTAQFVDVVGVTVLIVALPLIQRDLGLDAGTLSWVAAGYALTFGGFLVAGGRAADRYGRRPMFAGGNALIAAGSLVCALAPAGWVLLAGRAAQGLGAALSVPAALAAVLAVVPPGVRRGRALGLWTMAGAAGGASGFVLGGLISEYAGWRWLFAVIGPLTLAAAMLTPLVLPPPVAPDLKPKLARYGNTTTARYPSGSRKWERAQPAPGRSGPGDRGRLDLAGALLSTLSAVLLILGFTRAEGGGFADPWAWAPLLLAPLAVLAFLAVERRVPDPLVPPGIWSVRSFRAGAAVAAVLTATTSGAAVIGTLFLQDVLEVSAAASGAGFLLFSAGVVAASTAVPAVLRRIGPVSAMSTGLGAVAAALGLQAVAVAQESFPLLLAGLAGAGLGLGVASVASTTHGTATVDESTAGLVGGLLNAAAQIGTAIGIAVLLLVASVRPGPAGQATAFTAASAVAALSALTLAVRARR